MLKAYADEHVVFAIVQGLRLRGMDVVTVQDRGQEGADDSALLANALREERIMLTNDEDFLALASEHAQRGEPFAPVYFWPQQKRAVGEIIRAVIRQASGTDYEEACSRVYFL